MALQREHIVEQAKKMFVAEGIKSVRMDDIAQRLGISKRTLYEMFGDKENLLFEAMELLGVEIERRHMELASKAEDMLDEIFLVMEDMMTTSLAMHRMMNNLRKFYPSVWERLVAKSQVEDWDKLRKWMRKGIEKELLRDDFNIELSISMLYYMSTALMTQPELTIPAGISERQAFSQIMICFLRGLATSKGQELINAYSERYHLL